MPTVVRRRRRVVLSTVSSDSHTWNLVFLQLFLQECGYEVVNLGSCVPDEVIADAVREHRPDAVVISSVNGHGHIDGVRLIGTLRADTDATVADVPVLIGGKLGIQGAGDAALCDRLIEAGFSAVFTDDSSPAEMTSALRALAPPTAMPDLPADPAAGSVLTDAAVEAEEVAA